LKGGTSQFNAVKTKGKLISHREFKVYELFVDEDIAELSARKQSYIIVDIN
jgi:hypothetical protein